MSAIRVAASLFGTYAVLPLAAQPSPSSDILAFTNATVIAAYFASIEPKLEEILIDLPNVPADKRVTVVDQLRPACTEPPGIGWGFGDYMRDVELTLEELGS